MKRYISILVAVLALFSLPVSAQQTQDALYIYRNDGGFNGFFFADINRIEYSKIDTLGVEQDDYVVQEVYALDTLYRIPLNAIDSVTFVTPETIYKKDVVHTTESDLWNYVIGSDSVTMLILASNTPAAMIPKAGDKIVTTKSRNFLPSGFYGLVQSVSNGAKGITVNCEVPSFTDLFDQWVCKAAVRSADENDARSVTRSEETPEDVTVPLPSINLVIDISRLSDYYSYGIGDFSFKGGGRLSLNVTQWLRSRMFIAVRPLLGFNYDCSQRVETITTLDVDATGELGGQFDIPVGDFPPIPISNTPFVIHCEAGFSLSAGGKVDFSTHRKYKTSTYSMVQYNDSFYEWGGGSSTESFHTLSEDTWTSCTGDATISFGPYFGIYAALYHKRLTKTGFRFDLGMKATVSAELKYTDFLLATLPTSLPDYMVSSPTSLYDFLNRDGSLTYGPYFKCDFVSELGKYGNWSYSKTVIDEGMVAKLTGFDMGLRFNGGLVPEFKNTKVNFDKENNPTASVDIRRPALLYPPVGFVAYYTKSGKKLGGKTHWATDEYKESEMKNYSIQLPKFGGGKEVRVYPVVEMLRKYELLASPYVSYTMPAELKVTPGSLEFEAKGGQGKFTFEDNLDRSEDSYEWELDYDFGNKKVKPWITGSWSGKDYVVTIDESDSLDVRSAEILFALSNSDKSIYLTKRVTISQKAKEKEEPANARVVPTELDFPAEGGVKFANYYFGDYISLGRQMSDAARAWINASWSDNNKYPDELIVCVGPNTTKEERQDTIKMGFTMVKGSPFNERFIIPVVIKQAAGPHNVKNAKSYLVGDWRYTETVKGSYDVNRDYLLTFKSDGTYKEIRKEVGVNYDYKFDDTEEGTYEVTEIIQESTNRMRLKVKMTYKNGASSREAQFDVYAHRIFYWQPRLHYYDRE